MTKPTIAVDIDDVLASEAAFVIAYSNEHWGTHLRIEDYSEDWASLWNVDYEECKRRITELNQPGLQTTYPLIEGGEEVLQKLKQHYKMIILTSRPRSMEGEITEWFDRVFPEIFSGMHFTGFWETDKPGGHLLTKGGLAKQIGADYLIDDQPKHCFAAAEVGVKAILFGDYAVSRNLDLPNNVTRCRDWQAVLEYFEHERSRKAV